MARRRSAAEQVGVPELDEQEEQERAAAQAAREDEQEQARFAAEAAAGAAEPTVPDWVPEKFKKDPTKLVESYGRLENELRTRGEREKVLEQRISELEEAGQRSAGEDDGWRDRLDAAYEEDPLSTMRWLAEQASSQAVQQALGERQRAGAPADNMQNELFAKTVDDLMTAEYDDWAEVKPQIAERLAEDPTLLPETAFGSLNQVKRHMGMIYKDIKFDEMIEEQKELRERGLQQKDLDAARKREAQTLSGASGRAPEPSEAEKELAEMRAALAGSSYGLHRAQEKRG